MTDLPVSGQVPDPEFEVSERLFRRIHPEHFVSGRLEGEPGQVFEFGVEHVPLPDNYAHSEVHSYLAGAKAKPPRIVRKRFRDLLRRRTVVLKKPVA